MQTTAEYITIRLIYCYKMIKLSAQINQTDYNIKTLSLNCQADEVYIHVVFLKIQLEVLAGKRKPDQIEPSFDIL